MIMMTTDLRVYLNVLSMFKALQSTFKLAMDLCVRCDFVRNTTFRDWCHINTPQMYTYGVVVVSEQNYNSHKIVNHHFISFTKI